MCAYQGVRNVSFSEYIAYVLNGWPPTKQTNKQKKTDTFLSALQEKSFVISTLLVTPTIKKKKGVQTLKNTEVWTRKITQPTKVIKSWAKRHQNNIDDAILMSFFWLCEHLDGNFSVLILNVSVG